MIYYVYTLEDKKVMIWATLSDRKECAKKSIEILDYFKKSCILDNFYISNNNGDVCKFTACYDDVRKKFDMAINPNSYGRKLKDLKPGEYFTKKPIEYPNDKQVFIKRDYDRSEKKYFIERFSDIGDYQLMNGEKIVFTDFTF